MQNNKVMLRHFVLGNDFAVFVSKYHASVVQLRSKRAGSRATSEPRRSQHKLVGVPRKYHFCRSASDVNSTKLSEICQRRLQRREENERIFEKVATDTRKTRIGQKICVFPLFPVVEMNLITLNIFHLRIYSLAH